LIPCTRTLPLQTRPGVFDAACVLNRGALFFGQTAKGTGRVPISGPPSTYIEAPGGVLALASFSCVLTYCASSFMARVISLGDSFDPVDGWTD
jgi:hypothetical protein